MAKGKDRKMAVARFESWRAPDSGRENFKHRDLKNMTQYLPSGILKNVRGYLRDTGMTFILERLHCEHFFPAQVIPLF